jgi:ClpP class serine protease
LRFVTTSSAQKQPARRVLEAITSQPWALPPAALEVILSIAARENDPGAFDQTDENGNRSKAPFELLDGVAVIPVRGALTRYASIFDAICGAVSYEGLRSNIDAALSDSSVRSLVLKFDSPGGQVAGLFELGDYLHGARGTKPIVAFGDGLTCSAAYLLASSCDEIVGTESALVGSVGVCTTLVDRSAMDASLGIKRRQILSSGSPLKNPEGVSPAAVEAAQRIVDGLMAIFVDKLARNRATTKADILANYGKGAVLLAGASSQAEGDHSALDAGMVDRIATYDELLHDLQSQTSRRAPRAAPPSNGGIQMKNLVSAVFAALALKPDATEAEAVAAFQERFAARASAPPSLDQYVLRADYEKTVQALRTAEAGLAFEAGEAARTRVNALIQKGHDEQCITPATEPIHREAMGTETEIGGRKVFQANAAGIAAFERFLKVAPKVAPPSGLGDRTPPGTKGATRELDADEQTMCRVFFNGDVAAFLAANP